MYWYFNTIVTKATSSKNKKDWNEASGSKVKKTWLCLLQSKQFHSNYQLIILYMLKNLFCKRVHDIRWIAEIRKIGGIIWDRGLYLLYVITLRMKYWTWIVDGNDNLVFRGFIIIGSISYSIFCSEFLYKMVAVFWNRTIFTWGHFLLLILNSNDIVICFTFIWGNLSRLFIALPLEALEWSNGFIASYFFSMLSLVRRWYLACIFIFACLDAFKFRSAKVPELESIVIPNTLLPCGLWWVGSLKPHW